MGFFNKLFGKKEKESLDQGLQKTKEGFFAKISKAIAGKSTVMKKCLTISKKHLSVPTWALILPLRSLNALKKEWQKINT